MSGNSYETSCPNCNSFVSAYSDHKPFDIVSGNCKECGFEYWTQSGQMSLESLNEIRADYNSDNGFKPNDEDFLNPLTELPKFKEWLK